ncbi:unnamed protein product [Rhizophagus irregularis]|nr:unnamed protein product [Rhizophagus irregularis]
MHAQGILTMDKLQNALSGNVITYAVIAGSLFFFRNHQPGTNKELERTVLALNNEIQRMRTEIEWKNDAISQVGSNRFSSASRVTIRQYSEYSDENEMYWVEFTAIFDQRRKKEQRSPSQMYNIISAEIGLSPGTLASFYRHQRIPRKTTMDKIIKWIEKEGKRVVSFASNSSSSINNEINNS